MVVYVALFVIIVISCALIATLLFYVLPRIDRWQNERRYKLFVHNHGIKLVIVMTLLISGLYIVTEPVLPIPLGIAEHNMIIRSDSIFIEWHTTGYADVNYIGWGEGYNNITTAQEAIGKSIYHWSWIYNLKPNTTYGIMFMSQHYDYDVYSEVFNIKTLNKNVYSINNSTKLKINILDALSGGVLGDALVGIYNDAGSFVEAVHTSDGIGISNKEYQIGEYIYLQAYDDHLALTSNGYYVEELMEFRVPYDEGWAGEPIPVLMTMRRKAINIYMSVVNNNTFVRRINNTLYDGNTLDVLVYIDDEYGTFGSNNYLSLRTKAKYLGGIYLVWAGTEYQDFNDFSYYTEDNGMVYYIWYTESFIYHEKVKTNESAFYTQLLWMTDLNPDNVYLYVFDAIAVINGTISGFASFVNTGGYTHPVWNIEIVE